MEFHNLNFKLVVLEALLELGYFKDEFAALTEKYWSADNYDYEPLPEIYDFCRRAKLTPEQLAEVKLLVFDGGLEIYRHLIPNWDGEDDQFDVDSLVDIVKLKNLEKIVVVSMLTTADTEPLLHLDSLKEVEWYQPNLDADIAAKLRAKGIIVTL